MCLELVAFAWVGCLTTLWLGDDVIMWDSTTWMGCLTGNSLRDSPHVVQRYSCLQKHIQCSLLLWISNQNWNVSVNVIKHPSIRFHEKLVLNVAAKWLALLIHIREVPGSNLSPETTILTKVFLWFFSVLPGKCLDSTFSRTRLLPSISFPIFIY
jgi:hypothetical protein